MKDNFRLFLKQEWAGKFFFVYNQGFATDWLI